MRVVRYVGPIVSMCCLVVAVESCLDKGTEPPPNPMALSRSAVAIVPGTSSTVQVSGGIPPYRVIRIEPALPQVVTTSFEDSTISPATLNINVSASATIGDAATAVIGDAGSENELSISVSFVAVGNVSYSDDIQPIWDANCQTSCHQAGGSAPFSLNRFVGYDNLYFRVVSNTSCGAVFRVVPFSPDSSLLYLMITGRSSCPRMPLSPLPGDTLAFPDQVKILTWINQGALPN